MQISDSKTFRDLWEERVAISGKDLFLIYEDDAKNEVSFTFKEFDEQVQKTVGAFVDAGLKKGDRVVIHLPNSPEYLQSWFALLSLGAVVIHSNTFHSKREVNYTVENSDAEYVVTEPEYLDLVESAIEGTDANTMFVTRVSDTENVPEPHRDLTAAVTESDPVQPDVMLQPMDDAQIVYTSGTTSDPKGCVHTHTNLISSGLRGGFHKIVHSNTRVLTALPVFHCNTQSITLSTLTVGNELVMLEEFKTDDYPTQLRKHNATKTAIIGTQVRALLSREPTVTEWDNELEDVLFAINVTDEQKERFEERFDVTLQNGYGLTEAYTTVSMDQVHGKRPWPSIGRPAFDRDIHLIDDEGTPVEDGEVGEIAINGERGKTIMKEYYRKPEETAEVFTDRGWLRTGDFGRLEDGFLHFVDRKKNVIKTRGENVSESEVERVLETHDTVTEVAIVGIPHEIYGEAIKAYIKTEVQDVDVIKLNDYMENRLATFKVPDEYEIVEEFPRTSIGKIEKSTLRERTAE